MRCLTGAGRELFAPGFSAEGVAFGGRLDPVIVRELLVRNGIDPTPEHTGALRRGYHERMRDAVRPGSVEALAGAHELVAACASIAGCTIGLLTGNFEETGRIKLEAAGFDAERFPVRVWGDESPHDPPERSHLTPVAIERDASMQGRRRESHEVVIIGDTVHDIACASAHGCRSIGVATGHDTRDRLARAGAGLALDDLQHTREIIAWLTEPDDPRASA